MIKDLVTKCRSYRRFFQDEAISMDVLRELMGLARLAPSAANLQPLRYIVSCEKEKNARVFETLAWAGYLTDWTGPAEGERPAGYIVIIGDRKLSKYLEFDAAAAAQNILLGAVEKGLGGCIVASVKKERLRRALNIPDELEIVLVLALGRPKEKVIIESVGPDGDIKYWRDSDGVHHVPKRPLDDIIIG